MKTRHVLTLVGLILITVLALSVTWEFALEDLLAPLFSDDYAPESPYERWEFVVVATAFAGLALAIPTLVLLRLIAQRRRAEEELRRAKTEAERANLAKSRFLAAASHDLRQPLHAMGLFLSLLGKGGRGEDEDRELIDKVRASHQALDRLFGALLDISRLEAGVVAPEITNFAVSNLLEGLTAEFEPQAMGKGLELRVVASDAVVRSDPVLLERIVRNLVRNAVRYTESGRVLLGCRRRHSALRIEVWDTGQGIPDDQIDEVFREFRRLPGAAADRGDALGLGLAIVDRMARLLDHPIDVVSVPGKGSMFAVEVPLAGWKAAAARARAPAESEGATGATIVVVEDEASVLDVTRKVLEGWGHRVIAAESADTALAALATLDGLPDAVIADYDLGPRLTGSEAVRRIRAALGSNIPAAIMTGDGASAGLREAREEGCQVLLKPFLPKDLRALLDTMLRQAGGRPRAAEGGAQRRAAG